MSGKGGVGKSNIALNLGYSLAKQEFSTLLIDCDLGLANLDVLLGIAPDKTLQDVLLGNSPINEVLVSIIGEGQKQLALLPSGSGVPALADMEHEKRHELLEKLDPIFENYSMLLLDLGAGVSQSVLYFAAMAAVRVIVLTPEPTSLTDAYAVVKMLKTNLNVKEFLVIVNQAETQKEAGKIFNRLSTACEKFLGVKPVLLGCIQYDTKMQSAVRKQAPFLHLYPESGGAKDIENVAQKLTKIYAAMQKKIENYNPLKYDNIELHNIKSVQESDEEIQTLQESFVGLNSPENMHNMQAQNHHSS